MGREIATKMRTIEGCGRLFLRQHELVINTTYRFGKTTPTVKKQTFQTVGEINRRTVDGLGVPNRNGISWSGETQYYTTTELWTCDKFERT